MRSGIILAFILITALYSCQKKDKITATPDSVVINITSPASGQAYHTGDTVFINADVSYPSELHGYEIKVIDTASGYILYDDVQHVHDDHFSISDKWLCSGTQAIGLKLTLTAAIDHDGNNAEKDITFQYQP